MRRLLLAIPAALLLAAPPADAAKVEVFSRCTKYDCLHVATFSAAPARRGFSTRLSLRPGR
ncbi:MAG TPA: hypothetical protein VFN44_08475 [Solirubrobacteraceae bacterium]|nr:hypothetical protein [Solirubrobacteraceae bacterium]